MKLYRQISKCVLGGWLSMISLEAQAVVIRHDVADTRYQVTVSPLPGLARLYQDGGHGVLIAPEWVLTVAHGTFCLRSGSWIEVDGQLAEVAGVYNHPLYRPQQDHDIALLQLKKAQPFSRAVRLNRQMNEAGQQFQFVGSGGTGTGLSGQSVDNADNAGTLRQASNQVEQAQGNLLYARFDKPPAGTALEGSPGDGDSGTPIYQARGKKFVLFGLVSRAQQPFPPIALYDSVDIYTRIAPLEPWIQLVMHDRSPNDALASTGHLPYGVSARQLADVCQQINFVSPVPTTGN